MSWLGKLFGQSGPKVDAKIDASYSRSDLALDLADAAAQRDTERLLTLIEAGADVNFLTESGTALMIAVDTDEHEWDSDGTALADPVGIDAVKAECAQLLIDAGAEVDAVDSDGWTALMHAAFAGHPACVRVLLHAGANRAVKDLSPEGSTALELAKNKSCIRLLMPEGADLQIDGERPKLKKVGRRKPTSVPDPISPDPGPFSTPW